MFYVATVRIVCVLVCTYCPICVSMHMWMFAVGRGVIHILLIAFFEAYGTTVVSNYQGIIAALRTYGPVAVAVYHCLYSVPTRVVWLACFCVVCVWV